VIDQVGATSLADLDVKQARVGIPLDFWAPSQGDYHDDAQAHAAFLIMQLLSHKGIQIIGSVWEGPQWLLPGQPGKGQRVLDPNQYGACIGAIAQFLVTARDKYGVTADYFSFNEANYGVNFLFTPDTIDTFIKQAGARFAQLGLKTKFLVRDTTSIAPFANYVQTLIHDPAVQPYLGSLSFHCWDALSATDSQFTSIAEIGRQTGKPIYCTEAGWAASAGPLRSERSVLIVAPSAAADVSLTGLIPSSTMVETLSNKDSQDNPAAVRLKVDSHGSSKVPVGARSVVCLKSE
jgi:hypothetical protein